MDSAPCEQQVKSRTDAAVLTRSRYGFCCQSLLIAESTCHMSAPVSKTSAFNVKPAELSIMSVVPVTAPRLD